MTKKWWFWLFMTLNLLIVCFSWTSCVLGTAAIQKGEYKIIVETGDNFKQISQNIKQVECPEVVCSCSPPQYYVYNNPFNFSLYNYSYNDSRYWI